MVRPRFLSFGSIQLTIRYLGRVSNESLELVQRLANGDQRALEPLLQKHLPGLRAWVRMQAGGSMRAVESHSDLCQSVCREVLEKVDRFRYEGEGAFRHWLYTTATRKIRNKQKFWLAQKRDAMRAVPLDSSKSNYDPALLDCYASMCSPSQEAMGAEMAIRIEKAFAALSEEHREVILLSRVLQMTQAEIAARMDRKEGAIRALLFRALANLADRMG